MLPLINEQLALFRLPRPLPGNDSGGVLQLGAQIVPYQLRRARNRRLTLTIGSDGLRIGASLTLSRERIEAFAHDNADWIRRKLAEQARLPAPQRIHVADGVRVPLLGGEIIVRVLPGANRSRWIGESLLLEARPGAALNPLAQRALQRRALTHFGERLAHYAPQLGLAVPALALSSARTRWGSCSRDSGVRINWRLVHLDVALGDYVVVHELAHLHEMNHSRRFWAIVERIAPDWRASRTRLAEHARTLPLL